MNGNLKILNKNLKKDIYHKASLSLIVLILSILLISSVFTVAITGGGETEELLMVEEHHELYFENLTSISMDSKSDIHRLDIDGEIFDADEVRSLYHFADPDKKDEIEDELLKLVNDSIEDIIDSSFDFESKNRTGEYWFSSYIVDESLEETASGPIFICSQVDIILFSEWFDIPEEADVETLVYGALKVGGDIVVDIPLYCEEGHKTNYEIYAPPDLEFLEEDKREKSITKELDNVDGKNPQIENSLTIVHEAPLEMDVQTPYMDALIDIYELKRDVDREYISIDLNISGMIYKTRVPSMIKQEIPQGLNISILNADLLRLLYDNGFKQEIDDFLSDTEEEVNQRFSTIFEDYSDEELKVKGLEEGYNIDDMHSKMPLRIFYNNSFEKNMSIVTENSALVIQRRYLIDEKISLEISSLKEWGLHYTLKIPEGIEMIDAGINGRKLEVQEDETGRYYIEDSISPGETVTVDLTMGTFIDISSFLPFVTLILVLFFVWIGMNMYRVKKKKKDV